MIDRDLGAILVVGHNPGLSQFLSRLLGDVQIERREAGLERVSSATAAARCSNGFSPRS